ncbi:F-box/WD repeat-containing protein pof1 [Microthyrium microscopicum]|uniref:F-box/WD repeat-containing protein pof1 n=1 Tax=Microthyrium microscopicum TaxID=703497 RepID=A0A6A6UTP2_9PEZI|nr:F-box/WD repeat-containing protein pof1 [Microthyrium microscopicum]
MQLPPPPPVFPPSSSLTKRKAPMSSTRPPPRAIHTPSSPIAASMAHNLLPSAPASPPTPAPSPTPMGRAPDWSTAAEHEDSNVRHVRSVFVEMNDAEKQRLLAELLNLCSSQQLAFVQDFVSPRLKKDPFMTFPNEICLRILQFFDDPQTLARSSQVSHRWRELVLDDAAWKTLSDKYYYRRPSDEPRKRLAQTSRDVTTPGTSPYQMQFGYTRPPHLTGPGFNSAPDLRTQSVDRWRNQRNSRRRPPALSYRSHFKQRYMVDTAWKHGGKMEHRQITPDHGVVTSLHLTDKYIVVALDNAKIHVFDTDGNHQKTLQGHVMGVWAMVPWDDVLVSGGCDRDVRVWNMATGTSTHVLRGHTSTVRCLKMSDATTAISGSRDTTLRIWDIQKGVCKHVLVGHGSSVRCLEIHGDLVVSGSYDTTAKIWSIKDGKCLRTLQGHFSQIYAIAFDGKKIATGSLDTMVRIWDPTDGRCLAVLQGHTSLVGQLQMRGDILVTGGSDGGVRVWSLTEYQAIHRLAAHDNSVTSLQFDDTRIVSGGSDGRVKVWDLKTGAHVRDLCQPADAVWRVVFEPEHCVVMASRGGKTVMEVWSFSPPEDEILSDYRSASPMSMPDQTYVEYQDSAGTTPVTELPDVKDVTMTDADPEPASAPKLAVAESSTEKDAPKSPIPNRRIRRGP